MYTDSHAELLTVLAINPYTASGISVHAMDDSETRGNNVCFDTGPYDMICISLTLAILYIDALVNRYTPIQ